MNELQKQVVDRIKERKMIVILRGVSDEKIIPTVDAIIKGGCELVEITFDHTNTETLSRTPRQIKAIKEHFGDAVEIGAGTVLDGSDVCAAKSAGATFIISPNADESVIKTTKKLGLVSIPGAYTPTEICNAYNWGADFVKLFPLSSGSADYIKAVKAPLKHIPLLAVGGVTPDNLSEFIKAGAIGIGVGSAVVKGSEIDSFEKDEDFSVITERVKKFMTALDNV